MLHTCRAGWEGRNGWPNAGRGGVRRSVGWGREEVRTRGVDRYINECDECYWRPRAVLLYPARSSFPTVFVAWSGLLPLPPPARSAGFQPPWQPVKPECPLTFNTVRVVVMDPSSLTTRRTYPFAPRSLMRAANVFNIPRPRYNNITYDYNNNNDTVGTSMIIDGNGERSWFRICTIYWLFIIVVQMFSLSHSVSRSCANSTVSRVSATLLCHTLAQFHFELQHATNPLDIIIVVRYEWRERHYSSSLRIDMIIFQNWHFLYIRPCVRVLCSICAERFRCDFVHGKRWKLISLTMLWRIKTYS